MIRMTMTICCLYCKFSIINDFVYYLTYLKISYFRPTLIAFNNDNVLVRAYISF